MNGDKKWIRRLLSLLFVVVASLVTMVFTDGRNFGNFVVILCAWSLLLAVMWGFLTFFEEIEKSKEKKEDEG